MAEPVPPPAGVPGDVQQLVADLRQAEVTSLSSWEAKLRARAADALERVTAERDALAAKVQRVGVMATSWSKRHEGTIVGDTLASVGEQLLAALDQPPPDYCREHAEHNCPCDGPPTPQGELISAQPVEFDQPPPGPSALPGDGTNPEEQR